RRGQLRRAHVPHRPPSGKRTPVAWDRTVCRSSRTGGASPQRGNRRRIQAPLGGRGASLGGDSSGGGGDGGRVAEGPLEGRAGVEGAEVFVEVVAQRDAGR